MFKFIPIVFLFVSSFAIADDATELVDLNKLKNIRGGSDAIGERERPIPPDSNYELPTDENGRPRIICRDKKTMLDQTGCLQADGKLAKHCAVLEKFRPLAVDIADPCGEGWKKGYLCHDYAICLKDEGASTTNQRKAPSKYERAR